MMILRKLQNNKFKLGNLLRENLSSQAWWSAKANVFALFIDFFFLLNQTQGIHNLSGN